MSAGIVLNPSGWWMPNIDTYFSQFMPGPATKHNGFMRHHLLEAFRYTRAWNVAIDVGAHVGFWTWDMAQRFDQVFAFEATPSTCECLRKNVEEFDNVTVYNMAVGDTTQACTVHNDTMRQGNTGSNYIKPDPWGDIPMITLNQMRLPGCDLLKIDVEGFEFAVLCGASKLIKTYWPVVIMECADTKFKDRYGFPVGSAQDWLLRRGYKEVAYMRPDKVFVRA